MKDIAVDRDSKALKATGCRNVEKSGSVAAFDILGGVRSE